MEKLHTDITVQSLKEQLKTTGFDCSLQQISPYFIVSCLNVLKMDIYSASYE